MRASRLARPERTLALSVSGLRYAYPDGPTALDGLDLEVLAGERVGVVGPNGAGKTTLFLAVCGVLAPQAGSVAVRGEPVRPGRFNPEVGLVFQNPDDQLFCASVFEDVAFGPRNMGLAEGEVERRVEQAMSATGVSGLSERAPHHLSGGEKRMVAIASTLSLRPSLVIYDEPSANLDIRSRRRLIDFLKRADHSFLLASHDLELVLEVCDRVVVLDGGRIAADGGTERVMSDAALMERHSLEKPHSLVPHREAPEGAQGA
ncbi:ABC-type cobalt transport system ATPase component [Rubrobacter radiotolerans]|uniref:ABC transporter ATP-binding protein n=1 Tax=Rubrobacter radiotolerans TaxID=42256 RepID=A0A023X788_RUBRA|nr:ABC transporter ATP-binding protein [Rubrobacter radiotolerans]AHY47929.1 ABC-type cobalt transport system ATPase component [Rubrobacter radiotolerans]MDX5892568.1 ABC transporter ATP-binding protein [Rubrobacter radiotolerans]SMC07857.1 cobalt/nickel transport system ATP-binding protein [Rubrobacter radiotolerans DSM 5868]